VEKTFLDTEIIHFVPVVIFVLYSESKSEKPSLNGSSGSSMHPFDL
jgi:hypothetical protein